MCTRFHSHLSACLGSPRGAHRLIHFCHRPGDAGRFHQRPHPAVHHWRQRGTPVSWRDTVSGRSHSPTTLRWERLAGGFPPSPNPTKPAPCNVKLQRQLLFWAGFMISDTERSVIMMTMIVVVPLVGDSNAVILAFCGFQVSTGAFLILRNMQISIGHVWNSSSFRGPLKHNRL